MVRGVPPVHELLLASRTSTMIVPATAVLAIVVEIVRLPFTAAPLSVPNISPIVIP